MYPARRLKLHKDRFVITNNGTPRLRAFVLVFVLFLFLEAEEVSNA